MRVTSVLGCAGELAGGLEITSTLDNTLLTSISPSFVSPTEPTAVTITGSGFNPVPRVYVSGVGGTARPLGSVEVNSGTELTAIVPGALTPGAYDLIVVNPVGSNWEVDVLAGGLTVTSVEPPVIDNAVPGSLQASQTGTVTLSGSGFDVDVDPDPDGAVTLMCDDAGTSKTVTGTITTENANTLQVSFNMGTGTPSAPGDGSVCVVRLVNRDGALFDYSAISVTNSSLNIADWDDFAPHRSMMVARRGLAAAAGRPTNTSRYLYAIGGDSGVDGDPFARGTLITSVEAARVDVFGDLDPFALQRNDLSNAVVGGVVASAPRTQAGVARIGSFVYLVGGHDGTGAKDTLLRSQVLDPTATPEIDELDADLGDLELETGLDGGLYYYRVAALFPIGDASNPGGESLAGELLPVQLPDRDDTHDSRGIVLRLQWTPIPGAHGYRIYRTPTAGAPADQLELLAEQTCGTMPSDVCDCGTNVDDCARVDDGTVSTVGTKTPPPAGSLGVWHAVDTAARCSTANCALTTAREALVTVAMRDRLESNSTTDTYYPYAIGGRSGATYFNTFEVATVTVTLADGSQTVADWAAGTDTLRTGRAELGAWVMNAESSAFIRNSGGNANDQWIFYGGGRTTGAAFDQDIEAGLVGASGNIATWIAQTPNPDSVQGDLAGFASGSANGQIYTFGGDTSSSASSASLCGAAGGGCAGVPDLDNPNSLAYAAVLRMFMGYTQESAFFFLLGGHNGTNTVATTERTVCCASRGSSQVTARFARSWCPSAGHWRRRTPRLKLSCRCSRRSRPRPHRRPRSSRPRRPSRPSRGTRVVIRGRCSCGTCSRPTSRLAPTAQAACDGALSLVGATNTCW